MQMSLVDADKTQSGNVFVQWLCLLLDQNVLFVTYVCMRACVCVCFSNAFGAVQHLVLLNTMRFSFLLRLHKHHACRSPIIVALRRLVRAWVFCNFA